MIAGSCGRIDVPKLGCTKMEIVGVGVVFLILERPQEKSGCWIQETRIGMVLGLGQEWS